MQQIKDMELNILNCIIIQPELMNKIKLEDKHFINYKRLWLFIKSFYSKYKNLDPALMYSICTNKRELVAYLEIALEKDSLPIYFEEYQNRLLELINEDLKKRSAINTIYKLATDLLTKKIDLKEFDTEYKKILK